MNEIEPLLSTFLLSLILANIPFLCNGISTLTAIPIKRYPHTALQSPPHTTGFSVVVVVEVVVVTFLVSFLVNHIFTMFVTDVD